MKDDRAIVIAVIVTVVAILAGYWYVVGWTLRWWE